MKPHGKHILELNIQHKNSVHITNKSDQTRVNSITKTSIKEPTTHDDMSSDTVINIRVIFLTIAALIKTWLILYL